MKKLEILPRVTKMWHKHHNSHPPHAAPPNAAFLNGRETEAGGADCCCGYAGEDSESGDMAIFLLVL